MAKIVRYNGNLVPFASSSLGTERTIFGQVTQANDITSQFTPQFLRGWGIVGPSDQPTLQDFNAVSYTHGQILAYLHQAGIPEYNAAQEYFLGSVTQDAGVIYTSLVASNIGNTPASSPSSWASQSSGRAILPIRVVTSSGIEAPTAGVKFWRVRGIGGGGGSGSTNATGAAQFAASSGGASGSFFETILTAAQIGAGVSITIGAAGIAAAPNGNGGNGGTTIVGAFVTAPGGGGGLVGPPVASTATAATLGGTPGGVATGATILNSDGVPGGSGLTITGSTVVGAGAGTQFGAGGRQSIGGSNGTGYGSGAGGVGSSASQAAKPGIIGRPGVVFIEEFM